MAEQSECKDRGSGKWLSLSDALGGSNPLKSLPVL